MILEPHEYTSAVWLKIKEYLEERLEMLRRKNDNSMTDVETEKLRGRIQEVKNLLGQEDPGPEIESDDPG